MREVTRLQYRISRIEKSDIRRVDPWQRTRRIASWLWGNETLPGIGLSMLEQLLRWMQEPSRAGGTRRYWVMVGDELMVVAAANDSRGWYSRPKHKNKNKNQRCSVADYCVFYSPSMNSISTHRVIGVSGRTGVGEKKIEAMEEQGPQSKERKDKDSRIFLFWLQMQRNTMQVVCKPQKYVMQEKGLIRFDFNDQRRRKKMFSSCLTRNKKGPAAFFNHLANRRIRWQLKWERATLYKRRAKRRKREVEEEAKRANSFDTETHRAFDEQLNFRVIITIDVVNKTTEKGCNAVFE